MNPSAFLAYIAAYYSGIVSGIVEKLNDTTNVDEQRSYRFLQLLTKIYSVKGTWETLNTSTTRVMADIVSMDSTLPVKKRDAVGKGSGDIVKMGMEKWLTEKQLTELDLLVGQAAANPANSYLVDQIVNVIFADTPAVIVGIYERLEAMFLEALSTGITSIDDTTENNGLGVRLDYGYLAGNKFGSTVVWSTAATATPFSDLQRVFAKMSSDGNSGGRIFMDKFAYDNMAKTTQARQELAYFTGYFGSIDNVPAPNRDQFSAMIARKYPGVTIDVIDRAVRYERDGVQTSFKPWQEGAVVITPAGPVGQLVWATLAEMNRPIAGVEYQRANDFVLVSKFRENKPLSEHTTSQARVVPVIANSNKIYVLDSKTVQA